MQFWMDMSNVLSVTPWEAKPNFEEGIDRPIPLLYIINGGEDQAKILLQK
jgi:L-fucose isomerase